MERNVKDKRIAFFINLIQFAFCCNVSLKLILGQTSNFSTTITVLVSLVLLVSFLYITYIVFQDKKYIFLYMVFIFIYILSYFLGNADLSILINKGVLTMLTCVPVLAGVIYMKDKKVLYDEFVRFSYITIFIMTPVVFLHQGSETSYSMSFSYYLLIPCLFQLDLVFKKKQLKHVLFCGIAILAILAYGARGPIMSIAAAVVLELVFMEMKMLKKVAIIVFFVVTCLLVYLNLYSIIDWLQNLLDEFGIYSRSLDVLKNPSFDITSGRIDIFKYYTPIIFENPLIGSGVYGNWVSDDLGPHNGILECLLAFGIVLGTLLLAILAIIPFRMLKVKNVYTKRLFLIFLSYNCTMFFVSGNIMTSYNWFLLYGLVLSQFKLKGGLSNVEM